MRAPPLSQMGRAMTDGENNQTCDSRRPATIEGGHQPALDIDSSMVAASPTAAEQEVSKVYDLDTFKGFVALMANRHQNGVVTRDDALEMIAAVAKARQLRESFGDDQVCAVMREHFLLVVEPAQQLDMHQELASFPGVIGADRLQIMEYEPVTLIIPPLIAEGVTLVAGKPKLGKSWLMLDIALGIAAGKLVLGNLPTMHGQVLGLFLEDSARRLQSRIGKLVPTGETWPADLALATKWPRIDEGGLSDIEAWCRQAPNPKAIIIDTLAKLRPSKVLRKTQYELDYESLSGLHRIALEFHVAIIVVHHTRKAEADDVFDTVSGTLGLTGAADSILILSKRSGKAALHARGRDIEDSETALQFDSATCRWTALGKAADVFVSYERSRIQVALGQAPDPMSPKELMLATGIKNRNAIDLLLLKMVRDGQIEKAARGKYAMSGKIGKKDAAAKQAIDPVTGFSTPAILSDLSSKEEPGDTANERTTP